MMISNSLIGLLDVFGFVLSHPLPGRPELRPLGKRLLSYVLYSNYCASVVDDAIGSSTSINSIK